MITFSNAGFMILVMALTTYLIRVLPIAIFNKKLKNRWIQDFLYYIPFCVLAAMTFPDILFSTNSLASGIVATIVALLLSWKEKDLVVVALSAVFAAICTEYIVMTFFA